MKKILSVLMASVMVLGLCSGCGSGNGAGGSSDAADASGAMASGSVGIDDGNIVKPEDLSEYYDSLQYNWYSVTFDASDLSCNDDGTGTMAVKIWGIDYYDAVKIDALKTGDSIRIADQDVKIDSIEEGVCKWGASILINGGPDNGGFELVKDGDDSYIENLNDDVHLLYKKTVTLPVSTDWRYVDVNDDGTYGGTTFKEFCDKCTQSGKSFDDPAVTAIETHGAEITCLLLQ